MPPDRHGVPFLTAWPSTPDSPRDPSLAPSSTRIRESSQFGSWAFTKRAKNSGLLASMGRLELANAMFHYLEIWHNRKRRHSQLGWLTPVEFERNRILTVA
jgi:transposase InsO family protein